MANLYVRSTDGSDADNGSTWALGKATLAGAAAIDAAGDTIYASQAHSESTAAAVTWAFAGMQASPTKLLGGNDAAEPPTTSGTFTVNVTGSNALTVSGHLYCRGAIINIGSGSASSAATMNMNNSTAYQIWDIPVISFLSTSTGVTFKTNASAGGASHTCMLSPTISFQNSSQKYEQGRGRLEVIGGSTTGGTTTLFADGGSGDTCLVTFVNHDLSGCASTLNLVPGSTVRAGLYQFIDCKMPASWTGSPISGTAGLGQRVEMYRCTASYSVWVQDQFGQQKTDTGVYLNSGASDGTTNNSHKVITTADAEFPLNVFRTCPIDLPYNTTTGSSTTLNVELVFDSATGLTDKDVWVDVFYKGTSGGTVGSIATSEISDILGTAANLTSSTASWTGTSGFTNEKKRKISVSYTPQVAGSYYFILNVAKASTTLYFNPAES